MILHVTKAEYRREYRLWVSFNDGSSGEADLTGKLTGSMFKPLTNKRLFARFRVDRELGTVVWDNGADLAPEYLSQLIKPRSWRQEKASAHPRKIRKGRTDAPSRPFRKALNVTA